MKERERTPPMISWRSWPWSADSNQKDPGSTSMERNPGKTHMGEGSPRHESQRKQSLQSGKTKHPNGQRSRKCIWHGMQLDGMHQHTSIPGGKWELYNEDKKITKDLQKQILSHFYKDNLTAYVIQCHSLSEKMIYTINWDSMNKGLSKITHYKWAKAIKMIHGWLLVNEKVVQQNRDYHAKCPRYAPAHNETQNYVFTCPCPEAVKAQETAWRAFIQLLEQCLETAPAIVDTWDSKGWQLY